MRLGHLKRDIHIKNHIDASGRLDCCVSKLVFVSISRVRVMRPENTENSKDAIQYPTIHILQIAYIPNLLIRSLATAQPFPTLSAVGGGEGGSPPCVPKILGKR